MLSNEKTVFVEGPLNLWLGKKREEYFILKTGRQDLMTSEELTVEPDEEREGTVWFEKQFLINKFPLKENI